MGSKSWRLKLHVDFQLQGEAVPLTSALFKGQLYLMIIKSSECSLIGILLQISVIVTHSSNQCPRT